MLKKLSGKKLRLWVKDASFDYLSLCESYDKLGKFALSENLFENVLRISSLIRVSQEEEEDIDEESDVDILLLDEEGVNSSSFDYNEIVDMSHKAYSYLPLWSRDNDEINEFIGALSLGGRDVFSCLSSLARFLDNKFEEQLVERINLRRSTFNFEHDFSLKYALGYYFRNKLFLNGLNEEIILQAIIDDINNNRVTIDTMANFVKVRDENVQNQKIFSDQFSKVRDIFLKVKPNLANDNLFIGLVVVKFESSYNLLDIRDYLLKFKDENYFKLRELLNRVNKKYSYGKLLILLSFLELYPSDKIFSKLVNFCINSDFHSMDNLIEGVFVAVPMFDEYYLKHGNMMKVLEELSEANISPEENVKFSLAEYNVLSYVYPDKEIVRLLYVEGYSIGEIFNDTNLKQEPNLLRDDLSESDTPEIKIIKSIFSKSELKEISNPNYYMIREFVRVAGESGARAIKKINDLSKLPISKIPLLKELIPVYVRFFNEKYPNFGLTYSEGMKLGWFDSFNKFYYLAGENIYKYDYNDIEVISANYDNDLNYIRGLSVDNFNKILEHSGNNPKFEKFKEFYLTYPFAYNISLDEILNMDLELKSYKNVLEADADDALWYGSVEKQLSKALKIKFLGLENADSFAKEAVSNTRVHAITDETRDYLRNLYSENNFVGNLLLLSEDYQFAKEYPDYTHAERSFCNSKSFESRIEHIEKIRRVFSKDPKLRNIVPGSLEYNKVFALLSTHFAIRGAVDPSVMVNLFDVAVLGRNPIFPNTPYLFLAASAIETNDLSKFSRSDVANLNHFSFDLPSKEIDFCKELKLKPEWIINIGGFERFFSMSDSELVEFAKSHRLESDSEIQSLRSTRSLYASGKDMYSTFFLKCDRNILKNKLIYLMFLEFFNSANGKLLENSVDKIDGDHLRSFVSWFKVEMKSLFCGKSCEPKLIEIYKMNLPLYKDIIYPEGIVRSSLGEVSNRSEDLGNVAKLILVFRKQTDSILDMYSKEECKKYGYPVKKFNEVPNISLKRIIIHDLANLLPDRIPEKILEGYADYFKDNFLSDKVNNLKMIGSAWNSVLNIYDKQLNLVENGIVKSFIKKYSLEELVHFIKFESMRNVMNNLEAKNLEFAYVFCDNNVMPDNTDNISSSFKTLYRGVEEIFERGLQVELPSWASFSNQSADMTLRFLKRDEAIGIFLGKKTNCCQHPEGHAASCSYDGQINPKAAFAVFEVEGKIIYQSYVWEDENGNVCFDSTEASDRSYKNSSIAMADNAKALMVDFAKSLPSDNYCTVGSTFLNFNDDIKPIINLTETYKDPLISDLLQLYSPYKQGFYNVDSKRQKIVGRGQA
jgi:hypothetical protein